MNYKMLISSLLFKGMSENEIQASLSCLSAQQRTFSKNKLIYEVGQKISSVGIVLSGNVHIVKHDIWGNSHIISNIEIGDLFAESYACQENIPLSVDVLAVKKLRFFLLM